MNPHKQAFLMVCWDKSIAQKKGFYLCTYLASPSNQLNFSLIYTNDVHKIQRDILLLIQFEIDREYVSLSKSGSFLLFAEFEFQYSKLYKINS